MTDGVIKNTPVIRISVAGAVGDKTQMSFETYVDTGSPLELMHALTDKLMLVRDRQVAFYELKDLEKLLRHEEFQFEAMKNDLQREDERQAKLKASSVSRTDYKQLPKDLQARENIKTNIENRMVHLKRLKEDIEKRRELVDRST